MNVEMNILNLETCAVAAMKKKGLTPEDERVKFAIYDSGVETSYFVYGYWSRADQAQKDWKLKTIELNCDELEAIRMEKAFGFKNKIDCNYIESTRSYFRSGDEEKIGSEISSFFFAMKSAFSRDGEYKGNVKIILTGNSKKSSAFFRLMDEKISRESGDNLSFELIRNASKNIPDFDAEKERIQFERRDGMFFKYYLGENRGEKFAPFASLGIDKLDYKWKPVFDLPESDFPDTVYLYFTTKSECLDGEHPADITRSVPLRISNVGAGERVFIKAAGFDEIYYSVARNEAEAEEKLRAADEDPVVVLR